MEYTEQEIEMLARFLWRSRATMTAWEALHESERDQMRASVRGGFDEVANAAARLMREVREQGAAEMREKAAGVAMLPEFGNFDAGAIACRIRALPLNPTPTDAKASKLSRLQRELSDAGDRHDADECDRIDAEIEAVERSAQ